MELCRSHHSTVEYAVKKEKWRLACSACIADIKPEKVIGLLEADGMYENFIKESSFTQQIEKEMKRSRAFLDELEKKLQGASSAEQDLHKIRLELTADHQENSKVLLDYMNKKDLIDGLEAQYHQQSLLKKEILASLRNTTSFLMHQSGVDCGGLSLSKPPATSTQVYNNIAPPQKSEPKEAGQFTLRAQLARAMSLLAAAEDHYVQYYNKAEKLQSQLAAHESGKENADRTTMELRESNSLLQTEIRNQAETHKKQLEKMVEFYTKEISLLKQQLEVARRELSLSKAAAAQLSSDIRKQEEAIQNLRFSQLQAMDKLKVQYEQKLARQQKSMQQEIVGRNNLIATLRLESEGKASELTELANQYAQLSKSCNRLQDELANSHFKASSQYKQLEEIKGKYVEAKGMLMDQTQVNRLLQREMRQLSKRSENKRQVKKMEVERKEKDVELEQLRNNFAMLQNQQQPGRIQPNSAQQKPEIKYPPTAKKQ